MLTFVRQPPVSAAPVSGRAYIDSASLAADYRAFDRQRRSRRQYMKAFGGMAIVVLLGAAFNRVPSDETWIVAALLAAPPLVLAVAEAITWRRLSRRLHFLKVEMHAREKVIKNS